MAVRRESVRLSLEDDFTTKAARVAAATALINKELRDLDGTSVRATRRVGPLGNEVETLGNKSRRTDQSINQLTGRLRLLTDVALILGPTIAPLGAATAGALLGLSSQVGALAGSLGVTILALNGVGDAWQALNDYQLEPTQKNLEKLNEEMRRLGPAGAEFVRYLDSIEPQLRSLQMAARNGLLPGVEEGIDNLLERIPQLRSIIRALAKETGALASDAGASLAGQGWDEFFEFLRDDGPKILDDTARTIGNLTEALANLFAASAPTQLWFSGGLLEWSRGLADAARDLETNQGFQRFMAYIEETGPQVVDTLGALGSAILAIGEAVAPLGGPVLQAVEGLADSFATIARSDIGTPLFAAAGALALYNRAARITGALNNSTWGGKALTGLRSYTTGLYAVTSAQERAMMTATQLDRANQRNWLGMAKGATAVAGLAASMTGLSDEFELNNTASLALLGPWGALAGYALDMYHSIDPLKDAITGLNAAMDTRDPEQLAESLRVARGELQALQDDMDHTSKTEVLLGALGIEDISDVRNIFGLVSGKTNELREAMERAKQTTAEVARTGTQYIDTASGIAEANRRAAQRIQDATDAMREQRQEALRALNAELDYEQSLDDATRALEENGRTVDKNTEAGRDNLRALYAIAGAWNGLSDAEKNARGSLRESRKAFIETATSMGMARDEAKDLADKLFEIPPKRTTEIIIETGDALGQLSILKARYDAIRNKTVNIHFTNSGRPGGGVISNDGGVADGGTIPGPRQPYGDKMLYLLAPGEEVISNRYGQADRHRALLKAINANRAADGDTVGGARPFRVSRDATGLGDLFDGARASARQLRILEAQLKRSEKAFDRQRDKLDQIASAMGSLSSSVAGKFAVNLGAPIQNPWSSGAGLGNQIQQLTAQALAFPGIIAALKDAGLTGPALAQALQEMDFRQLQALAANPAQAAALGQSLSALFSAQQGAGVAAGQAVYGEAYQEQKQIMLESRDELRGLRQDVRQVKAAIERADDNNQRGQKDNADRVAAGVSGAAFVGMRRGR